MNPLMMMIQMAQRGRNPLGALQQMGAGPQLQQMQQMLAGKDYNQLLQMADNAARDGAAAGAALPPVSTSTRFADPEKSRAARTHRARAARGIINN